MHNNNNNNIETLYDVLTFGDSIVMYKLYAYGYVASYIYIYIYIYICTGHGKI